MKPAFHILIALLLCSVLVKAQNIPTSAERQINFIMITRDSVSLPLNEDFELIEDSCSQVIRYAKMNIEQGRFTGHIKDVSKAVPQLVITEGDYNADGLKDGYFTARYLNGNLQARGKFKNNKYDGRWEVFYADNKPRLIFEANGDDIKISDAWDDKGHKIVDNGNGDYKVDLGDVYWKGKLLNGMPDGTWKEIATDDASKTELLSESYKNGLFQKGRRRGDPYTDASVLELVPLDMLPFTHIELLRISATPCNGTKRKHVVGAQYYNGFADFSGHMEEVVSEVMRFVDFNRLNYSELTMIGEITTGGSIVKIRSEKGLNDDMARLLANQFQKLPKLKPATVDGKPVVQKISITFSFSSGSYRFSYRFLPVEVK